MLCLQVPLPNAQRPLARVSASHDVKAASFGHISDLIKPHGVQVFILRASCMTFQRTCLLAHVPSRTFHVYAVGVSDPADGARHVSVPCDADIAGFIKFVEAQPIA